jgi:predicted phosphodiesterase
VRLGVVSDLHVTMAPETPAAWHNPFDFAGLPARIDAACAVFAAAAVDAVVACGDVTHDGDEASARAAFERLSAGLDVPLLVVAGNHDCLEREDQLERCLAGGADMLSPSGVELAGVRVAGVPIERDGEGLMRWSGAGRERAAVVVSHFPVISRAERLAELGLKYAGDLTNRAALRERLGGDGPILVLSGHIHVREAHAHENVLQLSAGALVEAPYEVAIVEVDGAAAEVRRRAHVLGPPPAGADPVLARERETWRYGRGGWRAA